MPLSGELFVTLAPTHTQQHTLTFVAVSICRWFCCSEAHGRVLSTTLTFDRGMGAWGWPQARKGCRPVVVTRAAAAALLSELCCCCWRRVLQGCQAVNI